MSSKLEFILNGHAIKVDENKNFWEVKFSDGKVEKLYHHINAEKDAIWMWESGRIDEESLTIGGLIDGSGMQAAKK